MNAIAQGMHDDSASYTAYLVPPSVARTLVMDRTIDLLIQTAATGVFWPDLYVKAGNVLPSLPLTTREYETASLRLKNAMAYARSGESGAAAFELRQLRGLLA